MSEPIDPICLRCKHYSPVNGCAAFPDGDIPDEIIDSNEHSKPLKNQGNKIVFEPIQVTEYA